MGQAVWLKIAPPWRRRLGKRNAVWSWGSIGRRALYSAPVDRIAARQRFGLTERAFVVVHVGDFCETMRAPEVLRAFTRLALEWPVARLLVAGRNLCEPETRAALEDTLCEHDLRERVAFCGYPALDVLREALAAGDCQVNYSVGEPPGLSVYKGFCQKLPVCLPNPEGFSTILPHALYHENEHHLALNLLRLAVNPKLRAYLGEACFSLMPRFDYRVLEPKLLGIYEELVGDLNGAVGRTRTDQSSGLFVPAGAKPVTSLLGVG